MDHMEPATDMAALEGEIDALVAAAAAESARIEALLARTTPQPIPADPAVAQLRQLQRTARHAARLGRLIERQQAALDASLTDLGL
jgi:hypothetical protein